MRLEANPEYYDYIHFIDFKKNNECVFVDGAGQSISTEEKGYYKFHYNYLIKISLLVCDFLSQERISLEH